MKGVQSKCLSPSESLSDAEYGRLSAILGSFTSIEAMSLEEMDGFFAALICGPVTILPSDYLPEIWGTGEAPFEYADDFNEFLNLAMRHWNSVVRELQSKDMIFIPLLECGKEEEVPKGNRWAKGFLRGIGMCEEEWNEVFAEEDKFAMLLPVMALAHENDSDLEMRTWKTPPDAKVRENVLIGLAVSAQRLYDFFRPRRVRNVRRATGAFAQRKRKVGRNAPCYCGSGKKHKHCCGNVTIN